MCSCRPQIPVAVRRFLYDAVVAPAAVVAELQLLMPLTLQLRLLLLQLQMLILPLGVAGFQML